MSIKEVRMSAAANNRQNKRAYHLKPTKIALKGTFFELNDVSSGGIGLILQEGGPDFITGERIAHIPLELTDGPVSLQGVVSHISVLTNKTVCGIRFILTGDQYDAVMQFQKERAV